MKTGQRLKWILLKKEKSDCGPKTERLAGYLSDWTTQFSVCFLGTSKAWIMHFISMDEVIVIVRRIDSNTINKPQFRVSPVWKQWLLYQAFKESKVYANLIWTNLTLSQLNAEDSEGRERQHWWNTNFCLSGSSHSTYYLLYIRGPWIPDELRSSSVNHNQTFCDQLQTYNAGY